MQNCDSKQATGNRSFCHSDRGRRYIGRVEESLSTGTKVRLKGIPRLRSTALGMTCHLLFGISYLVFVWFLLFGSWNFPVAYAQNAQPRAIPCVPNLPCIQSSTQASAESVRQYVLGTFATRFLTMFLGLASVAAVIFIIIGGMQMHVALGNEEAVGKGKKTLIWAIGGLIISLLSVAIVQIISKLPINPAT